VGKHNFCGFYFSVGKLNFGGFLFFCGQIQVLWRFILWLAFSVNVAFHWGLRFIFFLAVI
jgi:hypothetical protein